MPERTVGYRSNRSKASAPRRLCETTHSSEPSDLIESWTLSVPVPLSEHQSVERTKASDRAQES